MNLSLDKQECKDLLDVINYYRLMPDFKEFANSYKDLAAQPSAPLLWEHFSSCSEEELSELAISCIDDIFNEDKI